MSLLDRCRVAIVHGEIYMQLSRPGYQVMDGSRVVISRVVM